MGRRSPAMRCIWAGPGPGLRPPDVASMGEGSDEGAVSADGRVLGCYLHGLFASDSLSARPFSTGLRPRPRRRSRLRGPGSSRTLDALADHLAAHIDIDRLLSLAR